VENFPEIFEVEFTARLEDDLDRVESSELEHLKVLSDFYTPFAQKLFDAKDNMLSAKGIGFPTDLDCPECGENLHVKVGKNGPFIACNGYPDCSFSRNYARNEKGEIQLVEPSYELAEGKTCDKCGKPMVIKQGRYGEFLACSGYPDCKNTMSVNGASAETTGIKCPEKECDGELLERKSKRGKTFYGCSKYPECTYAIWERPVDQKCPDCGAAFIAEKTTKKEGTYLKCLNPECDFKQLGD